MGSRQDESDRDDIGELQFEWHPLKAARNLEKHKVSFNEARTVFGDKRHLEFSDHEHSDEEPRFLAIGRSEEGRLLTLVFTERGTRLRLISARLAEAGERRDYEARNER